MTSKIKKIAVLGGAGLIGSYLVELLVNKGHKVVVIDDFSKGKTGTVIRFGQRKNHLTNGPNKGLKLFSAENATEEVDLFTIQKKGVDMIKKNISNADGTMHWHIIPVTDNLYDIINNKNNLIQFSLSTNLVYAVI